MARQPKRRSPARWLGPLALIAATALVGFVAAGTLGGESSEPQRRTVTQTRTAATEPKQRFYTVREGDVLSVIAERFGMTVEELESRNPDVDPQTLRPGTRLRLRR